MVRHAVDIAGGCGDRLLRLAEPDDLARGSLAGATVVHVAYTDRLFGTTAEESASRFAALAQRVSGAGACLSVTLHDVPDGESALARRRRAAYEQVVSHARGVVVNSRHELALAGDLAREAHSLRVIPLPVPDVPSAAPDPRGSDVVVLGFVYPDRGYEHTIDELPSGSGLLAVGRASDGHEDLPAHLAARAEAAGRSWRLTGFVPEAELARILSTAAVPVAPNRRVSASASINTWLAHGRRPLVPRSRYAVELQRNWPGCVTTYDPDVPGDLAAAVRAALADPRLTLRPGPVPGALGLPAVAARYAAHLASCSPPTARPVRDGSVFAVPGNRTDLLAGLPGPRADSVPVSVVVPYFDAQTSLDLVLAGLAAQTHPAGRLQVVVADDGSPRPPDLSAAAPLDVVLVRQEDRGFRAAAARNLGAAAADGDVLLFVDADTVPEPGYVRALCQLPARCPDALVVGRRRHADLTKWDPQRLRSWFDGSGPAPRELTEPGWLREGYAASNDLLDADARSYRFVISAVMGLSRELFDEVGGFRAELTGYGGEDWELAHRLYAAGAVLAHVPRAVAWHDGPDWAERPQVDRLAAKNAELLALCRLLPDPGLRGPGQWQAYPSVVVTVAADDPAAVLATARTAFADGADCGLWVLGDEAPAVAAALSDGRIRPGPPPPDVLARARVLVELTAPTDLSGLAGMARETETAGELHTPAGRFVTTRALARARRWVGADGDQEALRHRWFGVQDRVEPTPWEAVDLAHELARLARR